MKQPAVISAELLDRSATPFGDDLAAEHDAIRRTVKGSRILFIGGAGSIGTATLHVLLEFEPAMVCVVDIAENALAELTRDLRSRQWPVPLPELRFIPLDYGSSLMPLALGEEAFDHVLNFAALKHVRSEWSVAAGLRMLDVNVLSLLRLMRLLEKRRDHPPRRIFSVSTDKAADPVNLMGASKRLMEAVLLADGWGIGAEGRTSARFANVAFSAGSLLESWMFRIRKEQPLACPEKTRRYMMTSTEAGQLCTLAAFRLEGNTVGIPAEGAGIEEWRLEEIAARFLKSQGLEAVWLHSEQQARGSVARWRRQGRYPVLLTPGDTTGEKETETFQGRGEEAVPVPLRSLTGIKPEPISRASLEHLEEELDRMISGAVPATREAVLSLVAAVLPRFDHRETGRSLNDRM